MAQSTKKPCACIACVHLHIKIIIKKPAKNVMCEVVCEHGDNSQEDMVKLVVTHHSPISPQVHFALVFLVNWANWSNINIRFCYSKKDNNTNLWVFNTVKNPAPKKTQPTSCIGQFLWSQWDYSRCIKVGMCISLKSRRCRGFNFKLKKQCYMQ